MSLFDIKKNADEKAAQELAERLHQELMRKLDVHPLVNLECGRDVRDSYFAGIVFASLTDDEAVDDAERKLLLRIASSLGLSDEDRELIITNVSSAIAEMVKSTAQHVFDLLEEVAVTLKEDAAFKIFVAEFVKVCATKKFEVEQVKDILTKYVAPRSGHKVEETPFDALCRVAVCDKQFNRDDLLELSDWLGEDAMRYLMLDVFEDDVKPILDAHRTMLANRAALPAKLAAIIEGDGTWPVEFCPMEYADMFADAGVTDVNTYLVDAMLPKMKEAYGLAKVKIHDTKIRNDINEWPWLGVIFESTYEFRKLFRYAFFFDAYLDLIKLSKEYYFCGPPEDADDYCRSRRYADSKDLSFARRSKVESGFGSLTIIKALDRLRCTQAGYTAGMKNVAEYFERWERLFVAIAKEVC